MVIFLIVLSFGPSFLQICHVFLVNAVNDVIKCLLAYFSLTADSINITLPNQDWLLAVSFYIRSYFVTSHKTVHHMKVIHDMSDHYNEHYRTCSILPTISADSKVPYSTIFLVDASIIMMLFQNI